MDSGYNRPKTLQGWNLNFQQASDAAVVRLVREALLNSSPAARLGVGRNEKMNANAQHTGREGGAGEVAHRPGVRKNWLWCQLCLL